MLVRFKSYPERLVPGDLFDFERGIDSLISRHLGNSRLRLRRDVPAMDISDSGDELVLIAELPGVRKEEIKISIHDGVLSVSGERKAAELAEKSVWLRNEVWSGSFSRSFDLPYNVDATKVSAELRNGILKVVMPKAEDARPKEIAIR